MDVIGSIKEFDRHKEDWFLYRERLEQYFEANEITDLKRRVSILLTLLDGETYEILHNLCYPDLLRDKSYNQLCKLLEHHFCQEISVLRERMRFYSLRQNSEETISDWQVRIKKASKKCKFEKHLNTILVDKFLTGLYNNRIIDRICEEEFSTSKNLNDWAILVMQFDSEFSSKSSLSGAITSQSFSFHNTNKGIIQNQKNFNSKTVALRKEIPLPNENNENQNFAINCAKPINATQDKPTSNMSPLLKTSKPYVRITEQPTSSIRFRYACEGRLTRSLPGISSTPEKKTYPTIEVVGFRGKAVALVSCVTTEYPHKPHPYQLTGKFGCKKGVCAIDIPPDTMSLAFSSLGIQCIKKKDMEESMRLREEIRIDPYNTGYHHKHENISLNSVRLCIQVFLENDGKKRIPLSPVVTKPIYDKKMMNELVIIKVSQCVITVDGGKTEIILLCEKIVKDDIQVRFYEEVEGQVVWENFGIFNEDCIHKNVALSFKAPRYKDFHITEPVTVYMQLKRPSDGETSEPLPFQYYPIRSELEVIKRKRYNFENDSLKREYLPNPDFQPRSQTQNNFSKPVRLNKLKEEVTDPIQPYFSPMPNFPPNWNSNSYLQQYALPNIPTQQTSTCLNIPQNYNIPMNVNSNPFHVNNKLTEASCHNINIGSSFNNYLDVHQSNNLNNISLDGLPDLTQFNMEQLSDQFLNTLSLDNIPQE